MTSLSKDRIGSPVGFRHLAHGGAGGDAEAGMGINKVRGLECAREVLFEVRTRGGTCWQRTPCREPSLRFTLRCISLTHHTSRSTPGPASTSSPGPPPLPLPPRRTLPRPAASPSTPPSCSAPPLSTPPRTSPRSLPLARTPTRPTVTFPPPPRPPRPGPARSRTSPPHTHTHTHTRRHEPARRASLRRRSRRA